jgi:hypothetical protein
MGSYRFHSEEEIKRIRELLESGRSVSQISRELNIPSSTDYYYKPEVKERQKEYQRIPKKKEKWFFLSRVQKNFWKVPKLVRKQTLICLIRTLTRIFFFYCS